MISPAHSTAFTSDDFSDIYPQGIECHYWNRARNRIVLREVRHILGHSAAASSHRVLDVGCGTGVVTAFLRTHGIDSWGCDLGVAPPVDEAIAPYLQYGVDASLLPSAFRNTVRLILLLDVLEHLENPNRLLSAIHEAFPALDAVLFTVPARQELFSNYDVRNRHYRRYDHSNIADLDTPHCFHLERWSYFFHGLYIPARLLKFLGIDRQTELRAPKTLLARSAHAMLAKAFVAEEALLPGRWPGSSIRGVLRRI